MQKIIITLCVSLIIGCATPYDYGRNLIKDGQYDAAIQAFEEILQETPEDAGPLREIGIAHYKKGDYPQAINFLNRALKKKQDDAAVVLYLGLVYEKQEDDDAAIQAYRNYTQISGLSRTKKKIERRLHLLINQRMAQLAQDALKAEAAGQYPEIQSNTVAVMYFDNAAKDENLDPLRKGLTDLLITDLSKVKALTIVERTRMQKLLEEMELADAAVVDEETAPRTGRLLGAEKVVKGSFTVLPNERLLMNATFSDTATAAIGASQTLQGPLQELFEIEKALVFSIISKMKITLSPEEEEAIQQRPTESMLAFLAYSRGIDLIDRGNYEAAEEAFQEAVEHDPGFVPAQERLSLVQEIAAAPVAPEAQEAEVVTTAEEEIEVAAFTIAEEIPIEEAQLTQLHVRVTKDFLQEPEGAAETPALGADPQTREGDDSGSAVSTSRSVPISIIWEP